MATLPSRPTATRSLSPADLALVAKASRWLSADPVRSYRDACRMFGLPLALQAHLRVRRDADREGLPISTREAPVFMYAAAWFDQAIAKNAFGVLKIGVALRNKKPNVAVSSRLREHAALLERMPDASAQWAGSREMEARIVAALKAKHHLGGREWFLLRSGSVSRVETIIGRPLTSISVLLSR